MPKTGNMLFSLHELLAIHLALKIQIDYCDEALNDPALSSMDKAQFRKALHNSTSAIAKIETIFKENKIDIYNNGNIPRLD